ncbi:MAG TPA: N-acetyl-gamma-glutamyl-phosphate reductase [Pyrinomonadaceae bacterium]|nr:N-acetyl-gamma-glutamyl-phosphate reductase [Pyrinomonadaceae bacterium]
MQHEQRRIKVAIFGGSGYGGSELLRILLFHPNVDVTFVTANEHAGKPVSEVHRNLHGLTNLSFIKDPENLDGLDCVFFALPHGQAMSLVPSLPTRIKAIDLSGDFRLRDESVFQKHYKLPHTAMNAQRDFVYGLTETNREAIREARFIANPGCFATATLLGLAPLVANGLLSGRVIVDAKTGSSGSGAKAAANTHHPQRMNSFYAYKPFTHQHVPEIEQELNHVGDWTNELVFMTHSLPVSRGIFSSIYAETKHEVTQSDLHQLFADYYSESFFVRLVDGSPDINWVKTTNFCDIGFAARGKQVVVFSAIDNLVKGAAGQAVQNMNLMFGLDEKAGLMLVGTNP